MSENDKDVFEIKIGEEIDPEQQRQERLASVMPGNEKVSKKLRLFVELVVNLLIVVVLYFFIKNYLVAPFRVVGPSMCETLNVIEGECVNSAGEYLILNKATYADFFGRRFGSPERGDIIVFHPPGDDENFFIKRIIGLPGDTVELKQGKVFVKGKELPEPYLNVNNAGKTRPGSGGKTKFKVPSDGYFVLGDNRIESVDSRACFSDPNIGNCSTGRPFYLTIDAIEGRAWIVLLPLGNIRTIDQPDYTAI
jgi:signal peptidase I